MPNYQDSNIVANIFCDFVSQNILNCSKTHPLGVYFVALDIVNKKNLELYGFDSIMLSLEKIIDQIKAETGGKNCKYCFVSMDEVVIIIQDDDENHSVSRKLFQICSQFKITQLEYINIPVYVGYQKIMDQKTDPMKLFHSLLVNELKDTEAQNSICIETKIKNAKYFREQILLGNIQYLYQPIFDLELNKISYYECLMRVLVDGRYASIADYVSCAEELELGPLVDRAAFNLLKKTVVDYPENKFSFNLTASIIENQELIEDISKFFRDPSIAQRVYVEVTETSKLTSYKKTQSFITSLRNNKVKFVIDDFGSGYTSFHQLKDLEIDILKIDGSFVQDVLSNIVSQNFVKAVINICKDKNIKVVCEFVENEDVCQYLSALGVRYMQGYYFGQPASITKQS